MKNKTQISLLLFAVIFCVSASNNASAANPPTSRQASGIAATRELESKNQRLRDRVQKERPKPVVKDETQQPVPEVPEGEKAMVDRIEVTGAKNISAKEIRKIVSGYEKKELSLRQMQEVANRITERYRQKGYITSRAILPPQKIENGVLKIEIAEGRMGQTTVQGNKYFKSGLIRKKVDLKPGDPFNYNKVKRGLTLLNQSPDRYVKTVLTPGAEPGTTDLVMNVEDTLPVHVGFSFDNYGSDYLRNYRYQTSLTHNNLLGFDDIMNVTYQMADEEDTYGFSSLRYLFPLSNATQLGFHASQSRVRLGEEFEEVDARGDTSIYGVYLNHSLIFTDTLDVAVSLGFDYKDVYNYQLGSETSRDKLRVGKTGFKIDRSDSMGRTILYNELSQGFPDMWGSLDDKDSRSSRAGAGGQFTKDVLDVIRLHYMPWESTLLLKGQSQFSSHVLTATEQYQVGGIANVRAYPSGEVVGDNGYSGTAEMSFPVYGVSKRVKAPWSKTRLYDALRVATFYDYGHTSLRAPVAGESKSRTLRGWGCGLRYDLPESFSIRVDVAWPLDNTPSDGKHAHTWVKVTKEF